MRSARSRSWPTRPACQTRPIRSPARISSNALTDELEAHAREWLEQIEHEGGAVTAIERGFVQNAIADNAYRREQAIDRGNEVIVGVNRYADGREPDIPIQRIDEEAIAEQRRRVADYRARQDRSEVDAAFD